MPIGYSIDKNLGVVLTTATGRLTDEDILEDKRQLTSDPDFSPGLVELSDIRAVTELAVTPEGIAKMVMQDAEDADKLGAHKLAIVVSKEVAFGLARMYESMTEQNMPNVQIFREMSEAREWLGLPAEDMADAG